MPDAHAKSIISYQMRTLWYSSAESKLKDKMIENTSQHQKLTDGHPRSEKTLASESGFGSL